MSEVERFRIVSSALPLKCRHCDQEVRWRGPDTGKLLVHVSNKSMYCTLTSTTYAQLEGEEDD